MSKPSKKRDRVPRPDGRLSVTILLDPETLRALDARAKLHGQSRTRHAERVLLGLEQPLGLMARSAA